jgi:methionyl-tRNA formyltransferase
MIDWKAPAETIRNLIHGCWPWPAAQTTFQHADAPGKEIHVEIARARVVSVCGTGILPVCTTGVPPVSSSLTLDEGKETAHGQDARKTHGQDAHATQDTPVRAVPHMGETPSPHTGKMPVPQPGTVRADLTVATGEGTLQITRIQPSGKRVMEWRDFVNGYRVRPGDRFVEKT